MTGLPLKVSTIQNSQQSADSKFPETAEAQAAREMGHVRLVRVPAPQRMENREWDRWAQRGHWEAVQPRRQNLGTLLE